MALNLVLPGYLFEMLTCDYQKCLKISNHIYVYAKQSNNPSINVFWSIRLAFRFGTLSFRLLPSQTSFPQEGHFLCNFHGSAA